VKVEGGEFDWWCGSFWCIEFGSVVSLFQNIIFAWFIKW